MGKFAAGLPKGCSEDFAGTMKLLRNPEFQQLLLDYPRAKRLLDRLRRQGRRDLAYAEDATASSTVRRRLPRRLLQFVKENADKIAAPSRSCSSDPRTGSPRPCWTTCGKALAAAASTKSTCARPTARSTGKALADIISMVNTPPAQQEPFSPPRNGSRPRWTEIRAEHTLHAGASSQWLGFIDASTCRRTLMHRTPHDLDTAADLRHARRRPAAEREESLRRSTCTLTRSTAQLTPRRLTVELVN